MPSAFGECRLGRGCRARVHVSLSELEAATRKTKPLPARQGGPDKVIEPYDVRFGEHVVPP